MKIYVETYGCTANKSDESLIKGLIKESDHELVSTLNESDIVVILTCTAVSYTHLTLPTN